MRRGPLESNECSFHSVPDSAPASVKNFLKGSPTRRSIQTLIGLSGLTAAAGAYGAQWNRATLAALFFLCYAFVAWSALRWADRHGVFPKEEPNTQE